MMVFAESSMVPSPLQGPAMEESHSPGRFVDGEVVPSRAPLNSKKDQIRTNRTIFFDESMLVGVGGALANAVVFPRMRRRESVVVHPNDLGTRRSIKRVYPVCHFVPCRVLVPPGKSLTLQILTA